MIMKKYLIVLLSSLFLIIGACSNTNELEGKNLDVFTWGPAVKIDNISPSSNLIFDFISSDEVDVTYNGNPYSGEYSFDEGLVVNLEEDNTVLNIRIEDFSEHEDEEGLYTGTISDMEINGEKESGQLFHLSSNFTVGEHLGFYEAE